MQHIFQNQWNDLVEANNFQAKKDIIQVWLCRHHNEGRDEEKLCFLIGRMEPSDSQKEVSKQSDASTSG